jgi:hypothetical protein
MEDLLLKGPALDAARAAASIEVSVEGDAHG